MIGARRTLNQLARMTKTPNMLRQAVPQQAMRTNLIMAGNVSRMGFASFEAIEKATQKLGKALDSEIKYENDNYTQLEDIETFLN